MSFARARSLIRSFVVNSSLLALTLARIQEFQDMLQTYLTALDQWRVMGVRDTYKLNAFTPPQRFHYLKTILDVAERVL